MKNGRCTLTTKQIAAEYNKRYQLNAAESMQNAKTDKEMIPLLGYVITNIQALHEYWNELEEAGA